MNLATVIFLFIGHSNMNYAIRDGHVDNMLSTLGKIYQGYEFKRLDCTRLSGAASDFKIEDRRFKHFLQQIDSVKNAGVVIGGLVTMLGVAESRDKKEASGFGEEYLRVMFEVMNAVGNDTLPVYICRNDLNGTHSPYDLYDDIVDVKLTNVSTIMNNATMFPVRHQPGCFYQKENHHYTAEGYRFAFDQLIAIMQINGFDFWIKE